MNKDQSQWFRLPCWLKNPPAKCRKRKRLVQSLDWEDSPGEGNGNPLQYSCLGNPMDRGAWQATVHGVARVGHGLATKPPPPISKVPHQSSEPWGTLQLQPLALMLWILSWHEHIFDLLFRVWNNHEIRKRQLLEPLQPCGTVRRSNEAWFAEGDLVSPVGGWSRWAYVQVITVQRSEPPPSGDSCWGSDLCLKLNLHFWVWFCRLVSALDLRNRLHQHCLQGGHFHLETKAFLLLLHTSPA